jgi:FtsP/CotA-like multicopper oxidase with cupredoxin domain
MSALRASLCVVALAAGCGGTDEPGPVDSGFAGDFIDLNSDPAVVEVSLVAAPSETEILEGKTTAIWAYRDGSDPGSKGTMPGPLLELVEGQHVIVHFDNQLPVETTIHWHGIRLDPAMDGSNISQVPIAPGESFTYTFDARDPGFYWYHPHLVADEQIEAGLQAPLVIHGGVEPAVSAERFFVLDDIKIESTGEPSTVITQLDLMVGRQGNVMLVNGKRKPTIDVAAGGRERWRLVNSANGHFFNLVLPGTTFLVIGWDGGLVAAPYETDSLLIAPGERYDVLVEPAGNAGDELVLQDAYYDRGHELPDNGPKELMTLRLGAPPVEPLAALPTAWRDVQPLDVNGAPTYRLLMTEEMNEDDPGDEPEFFFNEEKWPDVTTKMVPFGTTEIWEIQNDAEMDHPFHLHGMFFQVLDVGGAASPVIGFKDTFIIPQQKTAHIAVRFDAAGEWMYHCHILEHAERGMMGHLHVMQ